MAADGARAENANTHEVEFLFVGVDGGNVSVSTGLPRGATPVQVARPSSVINMTKNRYSDRLLMEIYTIIG
jgi:hypothetical protein